MMVEGNMDCNQLFSIMKDVYENNKETLFSDIKKWCRIYNLEWKDNTPFSISLVPHSFSKSVFNQSTRSAQLFNLLVYKIALDEEFILNSLKTVNDEFTLRLISIFNTVRAEGVKQRCTLGINRYDFMVDKDNLLKQVEMNTISCAFLHFSKLTSKLHKYLYGEWGDMRLECAPNESIDKIFKMFRMAYDKYVELRTLKYGKPDKLPVILIVVEDAEMNSFDQLALKYGIWESQEIRVDYRTLKYIHENAILCKNSSILYLNDNEVALVYYRTGYSPSNYPTECEWDARLLLERSYAIKAPNISFHLIGTKKVQQVLSVNGILEKLFKSEMQTVSEIRQYFTDLYQIDESNYDEMLKLISEDPSGYIMKPQREGGGSLVVNDQLMTMMKTMNMRELANYILMKRIRPEASMKILYGFEKVQIKKCIAEIGIYGLLLMDYESGMLANEYGGWLLRSKQEDVEDGGVVAGRAYLDSIVLH